jgi:HD domain
VLVVAAGGTADRHCGFLRHTRRSGTGIPYLAHLLVVAGLVLEDGGDEDQAIAAMLHDAVEDGGRRPMLERIERQFGSRAAAIVEACSDTVEVGERFESWIERKRRYLAHLPEIDDDGILSVVLADKVHNARSIVRGYREEGHALWDRFTQKTAREQLWFYGGLLASFQANRPGPLTEDLLRALAELAWLIARDDAQRHERLWLWVDPDLHARQAPRGWVHVRTAAEAIALLEDYPVQTVSFYEPAEAARVVRWLSEQDADGHGCWPQRRIGFHGKHDPRGTDELIATVEDGSRRAAARSVGGIRALDQR